jgi:hypothetical protein
MSLKLYTYNNIDPGGGLGTSTGNMIQADLGSNLVLRQTANDGNITFQSDDGAGGISTYLTLDGSSTNAYFSNPGNVGIGTTSPTYKLSIGNNGGLADSIRIGNYEVAKDTRQYIGYARHDTGLFETGSSGNTPSTVLAGVAGIRICNTEGTILSSKADQSVQILTHIYNGSSRVALHANYDGNVGIGTTSPARKLTVNGSANVFYSLLVNSDTPTTGATTYAELVVQAKGNQAGTIRSSQWYFQTIPDSIYGNSALRIAKNHDGGATSEFMRITSAGNVGIGTTSPQARLDVQPTASNRKVTRIANDVMSTYFYNTQADAVLAWTCGSYYQAEVVITANQTNSGDYNNLYIRGIWSNNHTSHNWDELERVGFLTGSTFTMSVGQNGATQNSGRLELDFDYTSGSFSQLNVRVTDFYGTHSYTIT